MNASRNAIQWLFLLLLVTAGVGLAQAANDPVKGNDAGKNPATAAVSSSTAPADPAQPDSAGKTSALDAEQSSAPQGAGQKIQQLERRIDDLDQRLRAATANGATAAGGQNAQGAAKVTADLSGFTIQSADRNFLLRIGADLQLADLAHVEIRMKCTAFMILLPTAAPGTDSVPSAACTAGPAVGFGARDSRFAEI